MEEKLTIVQYSAKKERIVLKVNLKRARNLYFIL